MMVPIRREKEKRGCRATRSPHGGFNGEGAEAWVGGGTAAPAPNLPTSLSCFNPPRISTHDPLH